MVQPSLIKLPSNPHEVSRRFHDHGPGRDGSRLREWFLSLQAESILSKRLCYQRSFNGRIRSLTVRAGIEMLLEILED